jgi:hypothetical protein
VSVHLYVEGGARGDLASRCRRAFHTLLERAGFAGRLPRIVACGSRYRAYESFCAKIKGGEAALLLVDSEGPVATASPWQHVAAQEGDRWVRPPSATDDDLHLMVQCMEAWLLADRQALAAVFGPAHRAQALPGNHVVEQVSKDDMTRSLSSATRECASGPYDKGQHSFKVLERVDPARLRDASPWAHRFFRELETRLTVSGARERPRQT